ncbi:hypothetical protein DMENIID0001_104160 [Sergentomyia squamirostris]
MKSERERGRLASGEDEEVVWIHRRGWGEESSLKNLHSRWVVEVYLPMWVLEFILDKLRHTHINFKLTDNVRECVGGESMKYFTAIFSC